MVITSTEMSLIFTKSFGFANMILMQLFLMFAAGIVERVVLLGAPISIKDQNWEAVRKVIGGFLMKASFQLVPKEIYIYDIVFWSSYVDFCCFADGGWKIY